MSRQELATKLETTYLQVYRIETGVTHVPADDVGKIAEALDVSVAALYREAKAG